MQRLAGIVLGVILNSAFGKQTSVLFTGSSSTCDAAYLSAYDIKIVPSIPGTGLNVVLNISRDIAEEPVLQVIALMKRSNGPEYRSVFAFDIDYCRVFGGDGKFKRGYDMTVANILNAWISNIKKYGNMPFCPIKKGYYSINNLQVDKKSIPSFVIAGVYRLHINKFIKTSNRKIFYLNGTINLIIAKS